MNEEPVVQEAEVVEEKVEVNELETYTARAEETGDKVYVIRNKRRYWAKNPQTLIKMGFSLGQEKKILFSELLEYPEGEPVDLTLPDSVFPWDKPEVEKSDEPTSPTKVWSI